jgi:hypothetical protein
MHSAPLFVCASMEAGAAFVVAILQQYNGITKLALISERHCRSPDLLLIVVAIIHVVMLRMSENDNFSLLVFSKHARRISIGHRGQGQYSHCHLTKQTPSPLHFDVKMDEWPQGFNNGILDMI